MPHFLYVETSTLQNDVNDLEKAQGETEVKLTTRETVIKQKKIEIQAIRNKRAFIRHKNSANTVKKGTKSNQH